MGRFVNNKFARWLICGVIQSECDQELG